MFCKILNNVLFNKRRVNTIGHDTNLRHCRFHQCVMKIFIFLLFLKLIMFIYIQSILSFNFCYFYALFKENYPVPDDLITNVYKTGNVFSNISLTDIDDCVGSNLCLNNGICVDGANTYTCQCAQGFDGANCQNSKYN